MKKTINKFFNSIKRLKDSGVFEMEIPEPLYKRARNEAKRIILDYYTKLS